MLLLWRLRSGSLRLRCWEVGEWDGWRGEALIAEILREGRDCCVGILVYRADWQPLWHLIPCMTLHVARTVNFTLTLLGYL
jgi:hypothetical protein